MNIDYAVQIVWSGEDGAYIAIPAELPGCMADGQTPEEALTNLRQVIREWLDVAAEEGRHIPKPMSVEDLARAQQKAQDALQKEIHDHVQKEVKSAVRNVINQIASLSMQGQSVSYWSYLRGGFQAGDIESVELEHAGAGTKRH